MIEFKQGLNPYDTMEIGSNRPPKIGERYECREDYKDNIVYPGHKFFNGQIYTISSIDRRYFVELGDMGVGIMTNHNTWISYIHLKKYWKRLL
jgi:hypothetical protein